MFWTRSRIAQLVAYLLLAAACIFAVHQSNQASEQARSNLAAGARQAVLVSCNADRSTAIALRRALEAQKQFVRDNPEPPPPTTAQRIDAIDKLKNSIIIPNCSERVKLITEKAEAAANDDGL